MEKSITSCVAWILVLCAPVGVNADEAPDLTITYERGNGTVAPQYHEDRRITVRSVGDSEIEVTKGINPKKVSKAAFTPDAAKLKALIDYLHANHLDSPPSPAADLRISGRPGDGTCILYIEVRGRGYALPCTAPLPDMIRDLVPASLTVEGKALEHPAHPAVSEDQPAPLPNEAPRTGVEVRDIAIKTSDGHFLTAADGGGYGGPNEGPRAVALHSDASKAGPWEIFDWIWLDQTHSHFALRTPKGTFVSAVNGGGLGGPNDGRSPFHTDARTLGIDEVYRVEFDENGKATLRTRKGFYITAVRGGGYGGPNTMPIHTDATSIGPWEMFTLVPVR
jgi:hypothetical protein